LKLALEIDEPRISSRSLKFSCNNKRIRGERIMARLDQICIPNYLASNQASNTPHYYVRGDGVKSNHHHVNCVLEIAKTTQRTSMFQKMNIELSLERLKR
jgi:hypothetical protein